MLLGECCVFGVELLAGGGAVEQVVVGDVEFVVGFVVAAAGVGEVVEAFEFVFGEVGAGEGDEEVEEVVV